MNCSVKYMGLNKDLLSPDSPRKNFVFQATYQMVILVVPLIVSPFLTRKLGSKALGIYTYTFSIAYYFVIVAMLGINKYGQRVVADKRNDIVSLRKTVWSLYAVHWSVSLITFVAYTVYLLFFCENDREIATIQTFYVISAMFDITWLFYGLEKFRIVAIRNAIVKLITTVCIFIFINSPEDLFIYTIIMAVSAFVGQVIMFPSMVSAIPPIHVTRFELREHIRPLLILFVAVIAATLYTVFDKTLLGIMMSMEDVAFYEYADKIINVPKTFIAIFSTILYPRACALASKNKIAKLREMMIISLLLTCMVGFIAVFLILAIGNELVTLYYGTGFSMSGKITVAMSPLILIIGIGEVFRSQCIYPFKRDKFMVKVLLLNAFTNIIVSILFIPRIGVMGAVLGTICAELLGLLIEVYYSRKFFNYSVIKKCVMPFGFIGMITYLVLLVMKWCMEIKLSTIIIMFIVGVGMYAALTLIYLIKSKMIDVFKKQGWKMDL